MEWLFKRLEQLSADHVVSNVKPGISPATTQPQAKAASPGAPSSELRPTMPSQQPKAAAPCMIEPVVRAVSHTQPDGGAAGHKGGPARPGVWNLHVPSAEGPIFAPDDPGWQRTFAYLSNGQAVAGAPIVECADWNVAEDSEREALLEFAFLQLCRSGYVVLEQLLPAEKVVQAGEEFRRYKSALPDGVTFRRMRASRDMTIPPFTGMWTEDWLVRHPLVLSLIARYLRNSTDMSDEKAAEMSFAHWVAGGSNIDDFLKGPLSAGFPVLDLLVVVDTPAGAKAQTRHRDTILPGPCASLGMHIPLTPLRADRPLNGPIGFVPGTHRLAGANGFEVVGAVPPGSVVLYDSFLEHRGLENEGSDPRSALFAWFRVPGVYSGHTQENFGPRGLRLTDRFRQHVGEKLREADDAERARCPGSASPQAQANWGFLRGSKLVPWGEERVCFRCDHTSVTGGPPPLTATTSGRREWYCASCWDDCRRRGEASPAPALANVMPPEKFEGRFTEERLEELVAQGLNIKAGQGRHKLTLLRERGLFLPVDPTSSWLARISNDPQPSGWRDAMRKALGEIPRHDGF